MLQLKRNSEQSIGSILGVALAILLIGGSSLVLPEMLYHLGQDNWESYHLSLHGRAMLFFPFLIITVLFLCFINFDSQKKKWYANAFGIFTSFIPTYILVYMAGSPNSDALAGGILVIFAFVTAVFGYLLGWLLVKFIMKIATKEEI